MSLAQIAPTVPDFCYVENTGAEPVRLTFRGPGNVPQTYEFPPGQRRLAPRDAVNAWFGDPDLADHPSDVRRRSRTEAAEKIACRWGILKGEPWVDPNTGESLFPCTHLKVYDFDGNLLPTVHLDPEGRTLRPPDENDLANATMQDQLKAMQRQVAQLQAVMAEQGVEVPVATGDLPEAPPKPEPTDPEGGAVPDSSTAPKARGRKTQAVKA